MKFTPWLRARAAALAAGLLLLGAIPGCGALMTLEASRDAYSKPNGLNDVTEKKSEDDEFLVETSRRYGLMALFAETVYRGELQAAARDEQGCQYLDAGWKGDAQYGMPRAAGAAAGWARWIPTGPGEPPCMNHQNGLFYETYVYRDEQGVMQEAVIAFRGTENRDGQAWADWSTNVSAAIGIEPAQYRTAREHLPRLIARLVDPAQGHPHVKIYAVGHSLGGGLAQQAGYLSAHVREVFTFNTTPVTNWTHLRRAGVIEQGYPIIHRVYHGGEGLETPRFIATSATNARFSRHDVGVQFDRRQFAKGHSMKILACNFAQILSKTPTTPGSHHYATDYIHTSVLKAEDAEASQGPQRAARRVCDDDRPGQGHNGEQSKQG